MLQSKQLTASIYWLALSALALLAPSFACAQQYLETIKAVEDSSDVKAEELSAQFQSYFREVHRMKAASYSELASRYRKASRLFYSSFPELKNKAPNFNIMRSYKGRKQLIDPEVYGVPFVLISPRSFSPKDSKLYKKVISIGHKKIPILVMQTKVEMKAHKSPMNTILEEYISTLNARVFGFSRAQLIMPLSTNVEPAVKFGYNGLRDWNQHNRLRKDDQITRPIGLSNFAHTNGEFYSISAHPDFSLTLNEFHKKNILMTFFLWEMETSDIPDLIFQINYSPRRR